MTDMTPITVRLTADRAKTLLEAAGARSVTIRERRAGQFRPEAGMWAFFTYWDRACVWGIRAGAWEWNFLKDVQREFKTANDRAA